MLHQSLLVSFREPAGAELWGNLVVIYVFYFISYWNWMKDSEIFQAAGSCTGLFVVQLYNKE